MWSQTWSNVCCCFLQGTDAKEWKLVVQEIARFMKADAACETSRPLRYCILYDPHPSILCTIGELKGKRALRLEDAVLASYYHNEVRNLRKCHHSVTRFCFQVGVMELGIRSKGLMRSGWLAQLSRKIVAIWKLISQGVNLQLRVL